MKRNLVFITALAAGLATSTLAAQAPAAASAPATPPAPQAVPAKVAIIDFQTATLSTNEGQKAVADVQKKYDPKKNSIDAQAAEVDSLEKQLQALPATAPDAERATRERTLDTKKKALQRDVEDAQTAYQGDLRDALARVEQKVGGTVVKYAQDNGFTMVLNYPDPREQAPNQILWFAPTMDITLAVVNEYNKISGVAAPPPSAPAPARKAPASPAPKK